MLSISVFQDAASKFLQSQFIQNIRVDCCNIYAQDKSVLSTSNNMTLDDKLFRLHILPFLPLQQFDAYLFYPVQKSLFL